MFEYMSCILFSICECYSLYTYHMYMRKNVVEGYVIAKYLFGYYFIYLFVVACIFYVMTLIWKNNTQIVPFWPITMFRLNDEYIFADWRMVLVRFGFVWSTPWMDDFNAKFQDRHDETAVRTCLICRTNWHVAYFKWFSRKIDI